MNPTSEIKLEIKATLRSLFNFDNEDTVNSSVLEYASDFILPSLVYNYYKLHKNQNFTEYVSDKKISELIYSTYLKRDLTGFFNFINSKFSFWEKILGKDKQINLIGDYHMQNSKVLVNSNVYSEDYLQIEQYLNEVRDILSHEFKEMLPEYEQCTGYIKRPFYQFDDSNFDSKTFYYNFGLLCAYCLYFRVTDIHMDNVVIKNNMQIPFDIEFLFSPDYFHLIFGIQSTGLISKRRKGNASALLGSYKPINSYLKPILQLKALNQPKIIWKTPSRRKKNNIPNNHDLSITNPMLFIDDIQRGLAVGSEELITKTKQIIEITSKYNFKIRQLVRPTKQYRYFMITYSYPQIYLHKSFEEYYNQIYTTSKLQDFFKPNLKVIKSKEVEDCHNLVIPYYYSFMKDKNIYHVSNANVGELVEPPLITFYKHTHANYKTFIKRQQSKIKAFIKYYTG